MTYQELLVEFSRRRGQPKFTTVGPNSVELKSIEAQHIEDLQWIIQAMLEKIRDGDKE